MKFKPGDIIKLLPPLVGNVTLIINIEDNTYLIKEYLTNSTFITWVHVDGIDLRRTYAIYSEGLSDG